MLFRSSDHESKSDQEGNFMAFIATVVISETKNVNEHPFDGELSENADLQEAYNKLCKIAAKDAMSVDLGLKKINMLEQEKKILLLKLFDANELLNSVKIENMTLLEKTKSLELELAVTREQIDRTSTSKLDVMLNVQKSISDKTGLGFVEIGCSFTIHPPKFVLATSSSDVHPSVSKVKVHKEEVLASGRTRVDLSESKPKNPNQSGSKKHHKPQWFYNFCGGARRTRPNCFKLQASKQGSKQKVIVSKAQDPMALIHELVKVLNLYANTGAKIRANSNRNPNSKFASKRVWMQKTQPQ